MVDDVGVLRRWFFPLVLILAVAGASTVAQADPPAGPRLALLRFKFSVEPQDVAATDLLKFDLLTTDALGGQVQVLQGAAARSDISPVSGPSWSPDGSLLAIAAIPRSSLSLYAGDIYLLGADGSGLRQVTQLRNASYPVFSADGQTIYFARNKGFLQDTGQTIQRSSDVAFATKIPRTSIWAVGVDGTGLRLLSPARRGVSDYPGSVSPLTGDLAYTRTRCRDGKCGNSARLLSPVTGADTLLAKKAGTPSFSPDGRQIALASFRDRNWPKRGKLTIPASELYVSDVATGALNRITHTRGIFESTASWDPSGQRLAYLHFGGSGFRVFEINADGTCTTAVTKKPRSIFGNLFLGVAWQPGAGREAGPIAC